MTTIDISGYVDHTIGHMDILLRNHPDSGYEYFWMNFKSSVTNIAEVTSNNSLVRLGLEVNTITDRLNQYKTDGQYDQIGQEIQNFLKRFLWHILLEGDYYVSIAYTNFKRWLKYCHMRRDLPMANITPMDPLNDPQMLYLYFIHRIGGNYAIKLYTESQSASSLFNPDEGLLSVLRLAVSEQSIHLFNKLLEHYPEWTGQTIHSEYGVQLPYGIKNGSKIIKLLIHQ